MILFTNGHISKSRSMNLILVSNQIKAEDVFVTMTPKTILPKMSPFPCFVGAHHIFQMVSPTYEVK